MLRAAWIRSSISRGKGRSLIAVVVFVGGLSWLGIGPVHGDGGRPSLNLPFNILPAYVNCRVPAGGGRVFEVLVAPAIDGSLPTGFDCGPFPPSPDQCLEGLIAFIRCDLEGTCTCRGDDDCGCLRKASMGGACGGGNLDTFKCSNPPEATVGCQEGKATGCNPQDVKNVAGVCKVKQP